MEWTKTNENDRYKLKPDFLIVHDRIRGCRDISKDKVESRLIEKAFVKMNIGGFSEQKLNTRHCICVSFCCMGESKVHKKRENIIAKGKNPSTMSESGACWFWTLNSYRRWKCLEWNVERMSAAEEKRNIMRREGNSLQRAYAS